MACAGSKLFMAVPDCLMRFSNSFFAFSGVMVCGLTGMHVLRRVCIIQGTASIPLSDHPCLYIPRLIAHLAWNETIGVFLVSRRAFAGSGILIGGIACGSWANNQRYA